MDNEGTYMIDVLLDKKIVTKVKNEGKLDISEQEGISTSLIKKLTRKNIIYYGIMQGEQPVKIEQANQKFQAPLVEIKQLRNRMEKIKEKEQQKIGYIHINTIQIIIKSTFREGIKTPLEIIVEDNRIMEKEYKILGKIDGDLGFEVIKFNLALQYPIPITTKKINNCIGIICNFKNKKLMEKEDIPLVICYRISYALSNSCLSIEYKNQERIYTNKLFNETSRFLLRLYWLSRRCQTPHVACHLFLVVEVPLSRLL